MRPIRLTMSAFGSYAGEECVDFSKLDQGLFLVTGDTGSGKTTIFDGIVYALYDRTSGGIRDGNMMRGAYADLRTPTFVELVFVCRGEEYRIVRNPDYERESLRRDKNGRPQKTRERSKVELYLPDGSLFRGNKKDINRKVEELLGMDARQFMQMAMIAQGDFLKLLHARSEERKEIFSGIFNTALYGKMQEALRTREKQCGFSLKEKEHAIYEQAGRILYDRDWKDAEVLAACREENRTEELLLLLEKLTEEGALEEERCLGERKKAEEQLKDVSRLLEYLQALTDVKKILEEQELWLRENSHMEKVLEEREREAHAALEQAEDKSRLFEQTYKKELEEMQKSGEERRSSLSEQKNLEILWKKTDVRLGEKNAALAEWEAAGAAYRSQNQLYEEMYDAFFREQAGILARDLAPGMPCPVCGSPEHPHKAELSGTAPSQREVQAARGRVKAAEENREKCREVFQRSAQRYQESLGSLNQEGRRLLDEAFDAEKPEWREKLLRETEQLEKALKDFQAEYDVRKTQGEEKLTVLRRKCRDFRDAWQRAGAEKEAFIRRAERIRGEADAAQKRKRQLQKDWGERQPVPEQEALLPQYMEEYRMRAEELRRACREAETLYQESHVRNQSNRKTLEVLRVYQREYEMLQRQFLVIHQLSQTACGSLSGSARLDFESYVQRKYFEKIIQRANRRLMQMSSGQFLLKCRDLGQLGIQGKVGLDLDVCSLVTESVRDVKTLSGGESFLAALSLALGLADVVQDSTGAVRLETMFIDEGFGSLDEHAREQSVRVLSELAGDRKLIGIVSHVTELKEQIERQLLVTKGKRGSHVKWAQEASKCLKNL